MESERSSGPTRRGQRGQNRRGNKAGQDDRRRRRRRERRLFLSQSSFFGLGFALGLAGALYFGWLIFPLNPPVGRPAVFLESYKQEYLYMVSQRYARSDDWPEAKAALDQLEDPDIAQYALQELDLYLRSGRSADAVRDMAGLAQALGAEGQALAVFAPTPEIIANDVEILPSVTPSPAGAENSENGDAATDSDGLPTPTLLPTPTPILSPTPEFVVPTDTPLVPEQQPFALISQNGRCDTDGRPPQIEITVQDQNGQGIPLEEIIVSWNEAGESREDRFITGFKPEFGSGYADFEMAVPSPDENFGGSISYGVSLASGSEVLGGLEPELCEGGSGRTSWELLFQKR